MLVFRFVTIRLRLASPFYVNYINFSLPSCFPSSSCSKAGMSNSLISFVIIQYKYRLRMCSPSADDYVQEGLVG